MEFCTGLNVADDIDLSPGEDIIFADGLLFTGITVMRLLSILP